MKERKNEDARSGELIFSETERERERQSIVSGVNEGRLKNLPPRCVTSHPPSLPLSRPRRSPRSQKTSTRIRYRSAGNPGPLVRRREAVTPGGPPARSESLRGCTRWIVISWLLNKRAAVIKLPVPDRSEEDKRARSERNPEGCGNCGETVGEKDRDGESRCRHGGGKRRVGTLPASLGRGQECAA